MGREGSRRTATARRSARSNGSTQSGTPPSDAREPALVRLLGQPLLSKVALKHLHRRHETATVELTLYDLVLLHDAALLALRAEEVELFPSAAAEVERVVGRLAAVLFTMGVSNGRDSES